MFNIPVLLAMVILTASPYVSSPYAVIESIETVPLTVSSSPTIDGAGANDSIGTVTITPDVRSEYNGIIVQTRGHGGHVGHGHSFGHSYSPSHFDGTSRSSEVHDSSPHDSHGHRIRNGDSSGYGEGTNLRENVYKDADGNDIGTYTDTRGKQVRFRLVKGTNDRYECDASGDNEYSSIECNDMPPTMKERLKYDLPELIGIIVGITAFLGFMLFCFRLVNNALKSSQSDEDNVLSDK